MPIFDRACSSCDWTAVDVWEAVTAPRVSCPSCGGETHRAWLTKPPTAIGDEIDIVIHNGTKVPFRCRSKSERRRWMKEHHLLEYVQHVDGSTQTERWATMDAHTLENARILVERAAKEPSRNDPGEEPMHVTMSAGTLTPAEVSKYRARARS